MMWLWTPGIATRYPVYVISRGRWRTPLTVRMLERMGVEYHLVVEPQERREYAAVVGSRGRLLVTPFSELGRGSIPVRNWVWHHAWVRGAPRHWILDDNIQRVVVMFRNRMIEAGDASVIRYMEDFVDRYRNVGLAGPRYVPFARWRCPSAPVVFNALVYSFILVDTTMGLRWRGRYNEDSDLNIRAMKVGYATVMFWTVLQQKIRTMTMRGGNTDTVYVDENARYRMAKSLERQHPDVVQVGWRFGRYQHYYHRRFAVCPRRRVVLPAWVRPERRRWVLVRRERDGRGSA